MGKDSKSYLTKYTYAFWAGAILTILAWALPFGHWVIYPLSLLATWAHEMGHGVFSLVSGGEFIQLEVFANLGGLAITKPGGALTSAGGLVAAPILGAIIIALGPRPAWSRGILIGMGVLLLLSLALWVRNPFGVIAVGFLALSFGAAAWKFETKYRFVLVQLVGIQLALSALFNWRYLFTKKIEMKEQLIFSDTGAIGEAIGGPYWLWGGLILIFNLALLYGAYRLVKRRLDREAGPDKK
jgi:hypothetical protein